jgi:hypothetical protein
MDRREALSLAKLVSKAAPWVESIYALPVRPAEQRFPEGPYTIFLSSAYLCVEVASLHEWLEMLQQIQPSLGPSRLPLLEEQQFNTWVRAQLALAFGEERKPRCSTKDLSLFARRPYLNLLSLEVPFQQTLAPVVMSLSGTQNTIQPTEPEMMLTVRWNCPICSSVLSLTKRRPSTIDGRISIPGPTHPATGTEKCCPANVWLILESDEDENVEEGELFSVQIWQLTHSQKVLGEVQKQ